MFSLACWTLTEEPLFRNFPMLPKLHDKKQECNSIIMTYDHSWVTYSGGELPVNHTVCNTWSRGVYLVPGECTVVPGRCTWYLVWGGTWSQGGHLVLAGGECLPWYTPPRCTRPGTPPRPDQVPPPGLSTPSCVDRQTPVNLLPWPNFVAAGKNSWCYLLLHTQLSRNRLVSRQLQFLLQYRLLP